MCADCGNRGVVPFDYVGARIDALPPEKTFTYGEMVDFFDSLGSPWTRHVTLCRCRYGPRPRPCYRT